MIRRLTLRNWRAYENLDLELGPGATFVVASNGIGKTSLIMGLAWGLYGDASKVKAAEEIRGDADSATVRVELRLPSGIDAEIARTVDRKGKVALEASVPGHTIATQDDLDALLADEFGADPKVLAQLTIMVHGGAVGAFQGEFDLQDHLAAVFGVTPLFVAARAAKAVADGATAALRKVKTTQRSEKRAKDDVLAELQAVIEQLEAANAERETLVATVDEATALIARGERWAQFRAAMEQRAAKLTELGEEAAAVVGRRVAADDLLDALAAKERELTDALSEADARAASARGKIDLISSALSDLRTAGAVCPTCLRPLSEHDADQAEAEHTKHLRALEAEIAEAEERASEQRTALTTLRRLLDRARSLPVPLEPEEQLDEAAVATAAEDLERRKQELQELDKKLAVLSTRGASLQTSLRDLEEDEERRRELEALYRREALGLAAHQSLTATGNAITKRYIEPLAQEIEGRWKRMFGSGGLNLSPEGRITRRVGTRTLEFAALSGGEKVWALLLTRLLIAGASTRAPFIWLDEPLEHLDPRLRKVVAGTLAKASSGGGLRQVIVTTYEAELARRLMEDVPSASLLYVTST